MSNVEEAALIVVLKHCFATAGAVEEAAQAVALEHYFPAERIVAEEAAQLAAPKRCLAVARTVVEVAARHCRSAVVVEEAASKAEDYAQAVVVGHYSRAARLVDLGAAKLEHSALSCTAVVAAR